MDKRDLEIWKEYAKTVSKIKDANRISLHALSPVAKKYKLSKNNLRNDVSNLILNRDNTPNLKVLPLNKQDRKRFRSESTIDLHGHTREIDNILDVFCGKCIVTGVRNIVIISGKGDGILKNAVRTWLDGNPRFILGYFEIKDSRAESGAFGVRLRACNI